ncbi:protein of unknown function DUF4283 - like 6 [Theobroma cacao]|nr:protein of unknown function DUF4283 - like 6 [Theobroma cacao]
MVTGRPPDPPLPSPPVDSSLSMLHGTNRDPTDPKDLHPPVNNGGLLNNNLQNPPISPRAQKKFFLSVAAGEKPPLIPPTREPFWYKDRPAAVFFYDEITALAQPFKFSMIGKFSRMPRINEIRMAFKGIGLVGAYEIKWLDYKHILIQLSNEHDLNRIWLKQVWFISNQKMRVFKWNPDFQPEKESSLVPVWISFPNLRAHLYEKSALLVIAKTVGRPLMVDEATAKGTRPSVARVCIEYDCQKPPIDQVWIVTRDRKTGSVIGGYMQKVDFAKLPEYCSHCCHVGHGVSTCMVLGNRPEKRPQPTETRVKRNGDDEGKEKSIEGEQGMRAGNGTDRFQSRDPKQSSKWQAVKKPGTSGVKDPKPINIPPNSRKEVQVPISNQFDTIGVLEEQVQLNHVEQGRTERVNSNMHNPKNFSKAKETQTTMVGLVPRMQHGQGRDLDDSQAMNKNDEVDLDARKLNQVGVSIERTKEESMAIGAGNDKDFRRSERAMMEESWQTGEDTYDSVQNIGDFDGVQWAVDAGHVTTRKEKKKKYRQLEDRLSSVVDVHGEALKEPEVDHHTESQKRRSERESMEAARVQIGNENVQMSQLGNKVAVSLDGCLQLGTIHSSSTKFCAENASLGNVLGSTCESPVFKGQGYCCFNKEPSIIPSQSIHRADKEGQMLENQFSGGNEQQNLDRDSSRSLNNVDSKLESDSHNFDYHPTIARRRKSDSEVSYIPSEEGSSENGNQSGTDGAYDDSISKQFSTRSCP